MATIAIPRPPRFTGDPEQDTIILQDYLRSLYDALQSLNTLTAALSAQSSPGYLAAPMLHFATAVDFNAVGDYPIDIPMPPAATAWRVGNVIVHNDGGLASLTTAQCGVFTGPVASGTTLVASGTALSGITSNEPLTANAVALLGTPALSLFYVGLDTTTLYFRITQAQGQPATGRVTLQIQPLL